MTFHVGQKVVCVHEPEEWRPETMPKRGRIYTIRSIRNVASRGGECFVLLKEIVNRPHLYSDIGFAECRFAAWRFRPLVERKTDISIFEQMLVPREKELAE